MKYAWTPPPPPSKTPSSRQMIDGQVSPCAQRRGGRCRTSPLYDHAPVYTLTTCASASHLPPALGLINTSRRTEPSLRPTLPDREDTVNRALLKRRRRCIKKKEMMDDDGKREVLTAVRRSDGKSTGKCKYLCPNICQELRGTR